MRYIRYVLNPVLLFKIVIRKLTRKKIKSIASSFQVNTVNFTPLKKPEIQAGNQWDETLAQIVSEINANPATFLRCSAFSRSVHPDQQDLARRYYSELIKKPFFVQNILPKIHDVPMGDPYLCDFFPFASPMTIQHVYYLNLMKEQFGIFIPREKISHIVEIGGGYGNFCRLVKNFGYKGKYMIADLPSMLEIQKHYLSHALQNVDYFNNINFGQLDIKKLLPSKKSDVSILIGTFSISEMPLETRQVLESQYDAFDYLFFAYNSAFDGVNNLEYFKKLTANFNKKFNIYHVKDKHRSVWFLLCHRKNQGSQL